MFSRDKALHQIEGSFLDISAIIEHSFDQFIHDTNFCAGFLCQWYDKNNELTPIAANSIPITPFNGAKNNILKEYVEECMSLHPAPHVHSIIKKPLWSEISALTDTNGWQPHAFFVPAYTGDIDFILVCFSKNSHNAKYLEEIKDDILHVIEIAGFILSANQLNNRVRVMETYVREIGHDIASSVQAVISKLRNISKGLIRGPAAITKVIEAEEEIMATYRVADTLGITVDPDYNIGRGERFDVRFIVEEVVKLCASEAGERHVELRIDYPDKNLFLWGDNKGLQSALMQILLNAIKYAKGSSFISIRVNESQYYIEFFVTDKGTSLDPDDIAHIWEFGWRGERAKELHVNGSGIGLYTVNKIIKAHGGSVGVKVSGANNEIVTFYYQIPKEDVQKKYPTKIKF